MRFNPGTSIRTKGGKKLFQLGLMALRIIHICTCQGATMRRGSAWDTSPQRREAPRDEDSETAVPGFGLARREHNPWFTGHYLPTFSFPWLVQLAKICYDLQPKESQNNITNQLLLDFGKFLHLLNPNFLIRMSVTIPASLKGCNESPVKGRLWPPFKNCKNL